MRIDIPNRANPYMIGNNLVIEIGIGVNILLVIRNDHLMDGKCQNRSYEKGGFSGCLESIVF